MAEGKSDAEVRLILYHWTHSFSSQKVKASLLGRAVRIGFQHRDSSLRVLSGTPARLESGLQNPNPGGAHSGGQGCAYGGAQIISLRWKGYDSGFATHEMRQKSITLGIWARGLVPWALEGEAEGSAFMQPHNQPRNLQFLLFLVRIRSLQQGLAHLYIRFLSGEGT